MVAHHHLACRWQATCTGLVSAIAVEFVMHSEKILIHFVDFTVLPLDVCAPGYMVPQWMPARAPMSVQHGMGTHQQPSQPIPGVVVVVYVYMYNT